MLLYSCKILETVGLVYQYCVGKCADLGAGIMVQKDIYENCV